MPLHAPGDSIDAVSCIWIAAWLITAFPKHNNPEDSQCQKLQWNVPRSMSIQPDTRSLLAVDAGGVGVVLGCRPIRRLPSSDRISVVSACLCCLQLCFCQPMVAKVSFHVLLAAGYTSQSFPCIIMLRLQRISGYRCSAQRFFHPR